MPERPGGCFAQNVPVPFSLPNINQGGATMRTLLAALVVTCLLAVPSVVAADDGCAPCCKPACAKCCKVVCELKEVKKTVWKVECEEFCVPEPGRGCCVKPGKVRTRKKLLRKEITVKVPVYRCVVVDCTCGEEK